MSGIYIRAVKSTLGQQVCDRWPFVHTILGCDTCDTTSHIHGLGIRAELKLICTSEDFHEQADVFGNPKSKRQTLETGGNVIICIYKGRSGDKLDLLRLQRFQQKVGCSSRTCVKSVLFSSKKFFRQHQQQLCITASESISRFSSRSEKEMKCNQHSGGGVRKTGNTFRFLQTTPQPLKLP